MASFLAPGTPVTVFCLHSRQRLSRVVMEHLTVGPRAGWVRLQKPDGTVEHRTADTLTPVGESPAKFLSRYLEFYHRDEGRVLARRPIAGMAGQLTTVRAEVSRDFRVPEHRIGVRLAA